MPPPSPFYNPLDPMDSPFYYETTTATRAATRRAATPPVGIRANTNTFTAVGTDTGTATNTATNTATDVLLAASTMPTIDSHARIRAIANYVRGAIAEGTVDPSSAFGIIHYVATAGASWEVVEAAVELLAKGADGVAGTLDDLIPETTMIVLRIMLRHRVVRDLAAWAASMFEHPAGQATALPTLPVDPANPATEPASPATDPATVPRPAAGTRTTRKKRWFSCVTRLPKLFV